MALIEIIIVLLFGLILGSFATALAWRIPRGISWVRGDKEKPGKMARSTCVKCKKELKIQDLIPVFSYLTLKGKCRYCGHGIDRRYLLIELLTAAGCLGVYFVWGFTVPAFIIMLAVCLLVALLAIDMAHMILPDQLNVMLAVLAATLIVYQLLVYDFSYGFGRQAIIKLSGMVVFAIVAWGAGWLVGKVLKKDALGLGDVKFFAVSGLWLGIHYLPFFLIFSGFTGVLFGIFYRCHLKQPLFPFGPALILALYAGLILQGLEIVPLIGVQW